MNNLDAPDAVVEVAVPQCAAARVNATVATTKPVHHQVTLLASLYPNRTAIRHGLQNFSYAQLEQRATAISLALRDHGVIPGSVVGVGLRRSMDQIACLLGIFKAGAAFVYIDQELPRERTAFMTRDCAVTLVIIDVQATNEVSPTQQVATIEFDQLISAAHLQRDILAVDEAADLPAYLLYTSGSTGQPKAVQVPHLALAQRLSDMQQVIPLNSQDRFLQRTSLNFDVALEEILWPLTVGATVVLADSAQQLDADYLASLMAQQAVTIGDFIPSLLDRLLNAEYLGQCSQLRCILCGGEAMPVALMQRCLHLLPQVELFNIYGPTEAVINALIWRATAHEQLAPPIGKPLPSTKILVLNEAMQPVRVGEVGELYLGGLLGAGYVGQPVLTQQRFLNKALGKYPTQRWYRTGDNVRLRADGEIEFHGRIDHQVKLRGARIELGEIESALMANPHIQQACVVVQGSGDCARLVAYLVTSTHTPEMTWRDYLRARLPAIMVPANFVIVASLPLTATGKIDRMKLPAFDTSPAAPPASSTAQLNAHLNAQLLGMVGESFCSVLRMDQVGMHDDFFDLGGDSLRATELLLELDDLTGMDMTLDTLYAHPTIAALAEHVQNNPRTDSHFNLAREFAEPQRLGGESRTPNVVLLSKGASSDTSPDANPDASQGQLFLVHPGDGGSSMYLPLVKLMKSRPRIYAFTAWNLRERRWPRTSVQDIAADYVAQLRAIQPRGPYHLLGWSSGAVICYEMALQLKALSQTVALVGMVDPFEAWETARMQFATPVPTPNEPFSNEDWSMLLRMLALECSLKPLDHSFWSMDQDQQIAWVCRDAAAQGRLPASMDVETFKYLCQVVRLHCLAYDRYQATPSAIDILLFLPRLRDATDINHTYWPGLTEGHCRIQEVDGDHLSMMRVPQVVGIAAIVDESFPDRAA